MKRLVLVVVGLIVVVLPLNAEVTNINNEQLSKLLAEGVTIVDIRTPTEWKDTGVIRGSHKLTFFDSSGGYNIPQWTEALKRIAAPSEPLILICRTGSRTLPVSELLDKKYGYTKVYNVKNGINAWIKGNWPVEKSE